MYYENEITFPNVGTIVVQQNATTREVISVDKNNITLKSIRGYSKKIDKLEWNKILESKKTMLFQKTINVESGVYRMFHCSGDSDVLIKKISDKKVIVFSQYEMFKKQSTIINIKKQNWNVFEINIDELLNSSFLLKIKDSPYLYKKIYLISDACKKKIKKFIKDSGIKKTEKQIIKQLKLNILNGETQYLKLETEETQNFLYIRQQYIQQFISSETIMLKEDEDFKSKYIFPKIQNVITLDDKVKYIGRKERLKDSVFIVKHIKHALDNPRYDEILLKNKKTSLIVFKHEIKKIKNVQNNNTIETSNTY